MLQLPPPPPPLRTIHRPPAATPTHHLPMQGGVQLLFLGDSITESWRGTDGGKPCNAQYRTSCGG